jgi:hypothetical protein
MLCCWLNLGVHSFAHLAGHLSAYLGRFGEGNCEPLAHPAARQEIRNLCVSDRRVILYQLKLNNMPPPH